MKIFKKKEAYDDPVILEDGATQASENIGKIGLKEREYEAYIKGRKQLAKQYYATGEIDKADKYAVQAATGKKSLDDLKDTKSFIEEYNGIVTLPGNIDLQFDKMNTALDYQMAKVGNKSSMGDHLSVLKNKMTKYTNTNEIRDSAKNNVLGTEPPQDIRDMADSILTEIKAEIDSKKNAANGLENLLKDATPAGAV